MHLLSILLITCGTCASFVMGEEGKMQRDSKSVSGVKGESITLKWPPLDDGFQYFIVKHGKEIIGNMFGSTLAKLIKDKRFTVSWSKSILAVKIANLTDEDKGRYTLLVYADGKSVKKESVVLLDVAVGDDTKMMTKVVVNTKSDIFHASRGDDLRSIWIINKPRKEYNKTSVNVHLDEENYKLNLSLIHVSLDDISFRQSADNETFQVEGVFNATHLIWVSLTLWNVKESKKIRIDLTFDDELKVIHTAQLVIHQKDDSINVERLQGNNDDREEQANSWKKFACICMAIIIMIVLGQIFILILLKKGKIVIKFNDVCPKRIKRNKQNDTFSDLMISSPITYRPSHQPSISESENTSTSLRSPPPRPGKDAPPRPDKECDLYDDVSERTHLQKEHHEHRSENEYGDSESTKSDHFSILDRTMILAKTMKKSMRSSKKKDSTTHIGNIMDPSSTTKSTELATTLPSPPSKPSRNKSSSDHKLVNQSSSLDENPQKDYVQPMAPLSQKRPNLHTVETTVPVGTPSSPKDAADIPPRPRNRSSIPPSNSPLQSDQVYTDIPQDGDIDSDGNYEILPAIPIRCPVNT